MDLALIEGLMDTIGIQQSRMNIKNETDYVSIPENISEIFNIDKEGYYMHIINNTKNEDINQCVWSFYQCILYFLNKNYHLMSEQSKEQWKDPAYRKMMSEQSKKTKPCPNCGKQLNAGNMARHLKAKANTCRG